MKILLSEKVKILEDYLVRRRKRRNRKPEAEMAEGEVAVARAHAFVLFVSRIVGLAPVQFNRLTKPFRDVPSKWSLIISKKYCIISCLVFTVLVICSIYGLSRELRTPPDMSVRLRSMTARVVGSGDVSAVLVTSAVGIYGAPNRLKRLLKVLQLLSKVDNSLGVKMVHKKEKNLCVIIVVVLIAWTCLLIDDFSLYEKIAESTNSQFKLLQNYLAFYLLYYVVVMLEVQFAFLAYSIYIRLKRLNEVLAATGRNLSLVKDRILVDPRKNVSLVAESDNKHASKNKDLTTNTEVFVIKMSLHDVRPKKMGNFVDTLGFAAEEDNVTSQEPAECIRRLSDLHGVLCAAAREVDTSFGLPVLIILISTLLHLIVTPYFLILEVGGPRRPHNLVLQFLWCTAHAFRLFMLVEPCHRTKKEAAKTGDIVGEMLGHGKANSVILRRLELFSRQLLHRSPDFTALGVSSLDRPLIASVTAAVTTYLVILIQFQKQDDEECH